MNYKMPKSVFCLADLKAWIAKCEAEFGCDARDIMVAPEPGGDWDHCLDSSEDSWWEADGTVDLIAERIERK